MNAPQVKPIRIEPAYRDRDRVWRLVETSGPYRQLQGLAGYGSVVTRGPGPASIWCREHWALNGEPLIDGVEDLLHADNFIAASKQAFGGAGHVLPQTLLVNLQCPTGAGAPHTDVPMFRGAMARDQVPAFLLMRMSYAGLFQRWRVKASGIVSWFYAGKGGDYEYWPDGTDAPSKRERAPFGNVAIAGDHDAMYHRVTAIGSSDRHLRQEDVPPSAKLHHRDDGDWELLDGALPLARYRKDEVRVSLLWRAAVFADQAEYDLYQSHEDDLNVEKILAIFEHDMRSRGLPRIQASDPLNDPAWQEALRAAYPPRAPAVAAAG